jgi:hypothetical protein
MPHGKHVCASHSSVTRTVGERLAAWTTTMVVLTLSLIAFLIVYASRALGQPAPSQGIALNDNPNYVILPTTATQCQPFYIFYNVTAPDNAALWLLSPSDGDYFANITIPLGTGYLIWTCNIPAGASFITQYVEEIEYVVQSGDSSCLGNVTKSYTGLTYYSPDFMSYTATTVATLSSITRAGCVLAFLSPELETQISC